MAEECRTIPERTGAIAPSPNQERRANRPSLARLETNGIAVTVSIEGSAHRRTRAICWSSDRFAFCCRGSFRLACSPSAIFTGLGNYGFRLAVFREPLQVAQVYCELFDLWLHANRDRRTVRIPTIEAMSGRAPQSNCEAIGYGPGRNVHRGGPMAAWKICRKSSISTI